MGATIDMPTAATQVACELCLKEAAEQSRPTSCCSCTPAGPELSISWVPVRPFEHMA